MAAKTTDAQWDVLTKQISASFAQSTILSDSGNSAGAAEEYRKGALRDIKKIYAECAATPPSRYKNVQLWKRWSAELYEKADLADKAMGSTDGAKAVDGLSITSNLDDIRAQFAALHEKAGIKNSNDVIFAIHQEISKPAPDAAKLSSLVSELPGAPLSLKAKADGSRYQQTMLDWTKKVAPAFASSDKTQMEAARKATESFYIAYGIQVE